MRRAWTRRKDHITPKTTSHRGVGATWRPQRQARGQHQTRGTDTYWPIGAGRRRRRLGRCRAVVTPKRCVQVLLFWRDRACSTVGGPVGGTVGCTVGEGSEAAFAQGCALATWPWQDHGPGQAIFGHFPPWRDRVWRQELAITSDRNRHHIRRGAKQSTIHDACGGTCMHGGARLRLGRTGEMDSNVEVAVPAGAFLSGVNVV